MTNFILIAHRGNLHGPNPKRENQPKYLLETLELGYNVEVDVWLLNNIFYLGHDKPEYIVNERFFENDKVWVHCKNLTALDCLISNPEVHCFGHDKDDFVLTNRSYLWCYPKMQMLTANCIAVMPERVPHWNLKNCGGICTDYVIEFETRIKEGKL